MISDDDIKMCARALVTMFGKDAPIHAAIRANEYKQKGEDEGYAFWKRVEKAIEELLSSDPEPGADTR